MIITADDVKTDNHKYKETFKTKAKIFSKEKVLPIIGHKVGSISPLGVNPDVTIYFDESPKRFDTVFPACSSANSTIEISIDDLKRYVDIYKAI